jgi:hypothetical protein
MDVDYHVADEDLALAVVPGSNFNPKTRSNFVKTVRNFLLLRKPSKYVNFSEKRLTLSVSMKTSAKIFPVCATTANFVKLPRTFAPVLYTF